ncbi:serine/threonine-protein phosphatase 2A 56 kDa regulatory subunit delta isoform [Coemansia sp. RSA 552]|nr:serine/threonine-protein phosphatase 2A 56 kDa regulatory subunit delta isoform [Coemansia sp. RSA 552]
MVRPRKSAESFASTGRLFAAQVDEVPTLRIPRRPQSSRHSFSSRHEFRMLPPLMTDGLSEAERKELLSQKLLQCTVVFDFQNPNENLSGKEAKQHTLTEIVKYMTERPDRVTPDVYPKLFKMISANLFRTIPPQINAFGDPFDPEEDEPREEPAWPHLHMVYHVFLRFLESNDFNNSAARPYIDHSFTMQLLDLFDCEDVRERECLKTVLHRIYGKMLGMRSFIRRSINNIFLHFIYESQRHNGIAELLEILGSIINGFTVPLKEEHITFLHRVLLPLHKARPMALYYAQLAYCTVQFLEKEPTLADTIIRSLLRYWPKVNSPKEVMFVNELEGIMDVIEPAQFTAICQPLFQQLIKCLVSPHFQIAERTLGMWRNNYFISLITDNIHLILPIALSGIYRHSRTHWNRSIHSQVYQILRFFIGVNEKLFEQCLVDFRRQRDLEHLHAKKSKCLWTNIEKLAMGKAGYDAPIAKQPTPDAARQTSDATESSPLSEPRPPAASQDIEADPSPVDDSQQHHSMDESTSEPAKADLADGAGNSAQHETSEDMPGDSLNELPMSKLINHEAADCEMDEAEFTAELDKLVDMIKAEEPDAAMLNGMMFPEDSDGSGAAEEILGQDMQGQYIYGGQPGQYEHHGGQPHAELLHSMMNGDGGMSTHAMMDPSRMQIDYESGTIVTSDGTMSIASTLMHQNLVSASAYDGHYAVADDGHLSAGFSDARIGDAAGHGEPGVPVIVSPIPSSADDMVPETPQLQGSSEARGMAIGSADTEPTTPPSSASI